MRVRRFAGLLKNFPPGGGGPPDPLCVPWAEPGWKVVGTVAFGRSMVLTDPGPGSALEGASRGSSLAMTVSMPSRVGAALVISGLPTEGLWELDSDTERSTDGTDCGEGVFSNEVEP